MTFDIPKEFTDRLDASQAVGVADSRKFERLHAGNERWMVPNWALLRLGFPPKTDDEDLAYLHQVAASRTPQGIATAQYWATHGLTSEWEDLLKQYTSKVGPAQAKQAEKLLDDALMMVNNATQTAKSSTARKRPFIVDPTLELVIERPGNNPSFPSGHTSAAYAACLVLAHLMPDRKAEFMGMAKQASWARVYGGVHFPTDVIAGVKLATTITSLLTRQSKAKPKLGTATGAPTGTAGNTGVAGGRHGALAGAAHLTGPALAGAPAPLAA
jgi:YD repeat-containing protein